ncbi:MAG TPA: NAD-glutamate dehydrogenase domain-containing protein [Dokdonella sp.]|uniref:NAD-glutamate dehydrogenase n=1 Tax=Dokdonella sp. TaxID=2291710 RepID=UPI002D803E6A|nr:NAD-glutamate dehydrogenase domain-containing protein [Dokdonella sp.]HET9032003.1 NAD-glutamate dehydrogenase domain-containing protein [Dokdonella sp.]
MNAPSATSEAQRLEPILSQISDQAGASRQRETQAFAAHFFRHVPADDIGARDAGEWARIAQFMFEFVRQRKPHAAKIRVFNPQLAEEGFESSHTMIAVGTDDMPFLVDSVSMAINHAGLMTHAVIHPIFCVARDPGGHVLSFGDEQSGEGEAESIMLFEVERISDAEEIESLRKNIVAAVDDVRASVRDWPQMKAKMLAIADELPTLNVHFDKGSLDEAQEFLKWIADDHFTFLGFREYHVVNENGEEVLKAVADSGLGIMRAEGLGKSVRSLSTLAASGLDKSGSVGALILTKTNARSRVHRPGHMDYLSVLGFNEAGKPVIEKRFLGLLTSSAYMTPPREVPLLRNNYETIIKRSGLKRDSHSGKALRHILDTLPRDELFQCSTNELYDIAMAVLDLRERARSRLFIRQDRYGRFFSVLAYVPRDRFNTDVRERIEAMLTKQFEAERIDSTVLLDESPLARVHMIVRPKKGASVKWDVAELEARIVEIVRNWQDDLREILVREHGEERGGKLASRYGKALPAGYIEKVTPQNAAADVVLAAAIADAEDIQFNLYPSQQHEGVLHFKVFRLGADITLSEVIPLLENLGLSVLTENLYEIKGENDAITIQDILVRPVNLAFDLDNVRELFQQAFERVWRGDAENDGFNKLVLAAQLNWRQVSILRGYCKYLLQTGVTFSQSYMEQTLANYPDIAGLLVELFEAKFDPRRLDGGAEAIESARSHLRDELETLVPQSSLDENPGLIDDLIACRDQDREIQIGVILGTIQSLLGRVASLDEDRILRGFSAVIRATLRTNFYQQVDGKPHEYTSLKFDPSMLNELPKPRPYREIFVYSPRVEGVHMRFGPVARGGLRWSDRREDFRTEVLGLVKAQMVKNTVIVPVGSKGGFIAKRPPASGERDAVLAEGVACYRMFINGMLDVTDNLVEGNLVHPQDVVRHDDPDPYLVVAADKGTATFSDIANAVSAEHDYWLGDAFASGGSVGYDHKGMGITAKGAWESVKRHFRALGQDSQSMDFTCAGIGDMSGDVFGNGMLLSKHIRLVAAFDHRHIFIDPTPDSASSYVERQRMFKVPRSSWADYDASLISAGGGVFPRSAKTIEISEQAATALGIEGGAQSMSPNDLLSAVLKAPVDLLWNGGIGTYIKSSAETHGDVGDRANNAIRINGADVRARIIGEGGNLGMTQRGRIEAAMNGVLLNTDFIDNSAGVDTSDHEVNIKILLNDAVHREEMTVDQRNTLLREMTDEVERLVLIDNYRQNEAISIMERMSVARLGSKQHFIRTLESQGLLDRQIEFLPSDKELSGRKSRGVGLTRPELAILLSYSKIVIFQQLLDSDVPEDPYLSRELRRYFPEPLRERFAEHMERHRLKREIIATAVTNSMVNRMGATFMLRMQEDTGQTPAAVAKAFNIAREVLEARGLWAEIEALDGKVNGNAQIDANLAIWKMLRSMTRWLLNHPGEFDDIAAAVDSYWPPMNELKQGIDGVTSAAERGVFEAGREVWIEQGFPADLADKLAHLPALGSGMDIALVARESGHSVLDVASVFFAVGEALNLKWLMEKVEELPVETRWHAHARGSLRDELNAQHRSLVTQMLSFKSAGEGADRVAEWMNREDPVLKATLATLADMRTQVVIDYPIVSVAVRRLAQLL